MNSLTANQLIRWAIPGWTMLLAFFLFEIQDAVLNRSMDPVLRVLQVGSNQGSGTAGVLIGLIGTVAGVPLGFLIYQVYYFFRWNWHHSARGLLYPQWLCAEAQKVWWRHVLGWIAGPGRIDEIRDGFLGDGNDHIRMTQIFPDRLGTAADIDYLFDSLSACGDGDEAACTIANGTRIDHREIWSMLEAKWLSLTCTEDERDDTVWGRRVTALFDALHGLGAARWALVFGYLLFLAHQWYRGRLPYWGLEIDWVSSVVTLLTMLALFLVITKNRSQVLLRIESHWHHVFSEYVRGLRIPAKPVPATRTRLALGRWHPLKRRTTRHATP